MSLFLIVGLILVWSSVAVLSLVAMQSLNEAYATYRAESIEQEREKLDELFLSFPAEHFFRIRIASVVACFFLGFVISFHPVFALLAAGGGFFLPRLALNFLRQRRKRTFESQLPEALDLLSNSMKAGFSLMQALEVVVKEQAAPLSQEFGLMMKEYRLGVNLDQSLQTMARRVNSEDLHLVVTATIIARTVGGNLAEMFQTVSHTIRERMKLEGKIRSMTAQGRMQGVVVGLLPFIMAFVLSMIDPTLIQPLFDEFLGWVAIGVILVLELIGAIWIKKIVSIEI